MNDNIFNENENNLNQYIQNNKYYDSEEADKLENLPGIYSETSEEKNKSNSDLSLENYDYLANEEIIPYSPEMSEEPVHPNQRKKIITENINNHRNEQNNDIFTFKNNIKKAPDDNLTLKDNIFKQKNNHLKKIDYPMNTDNEETNMNQIKANVLNFEDIINKRNNEILNQSNELMYEFSIGNKIQNNRNNSKNELNKKLNKKQKSQKNFQNIKASKKITKTNNIKKINKSQKKSDKIRIFENKSMDAVEFENFMKNKDNSIFEKSKNKNNFKNRYKKLNEESIRYRKNNENMNSFNKSRDDINNLKMRQKIVNQQFKRNNLNNNTEIISKNINDEIYFNNFPKNKNIKKDSNYSEIQIEVDNNFSFFQNKKSLSRQVKKHAKTKKQNLRDLRRVIDIGVSMDVTEDEINAAIKNKNIGKNIQKRLMPAKNNITNYDNSKFEKYNVERIRYELIKDFSNIHPDIKKGFLQRMQFDSLKRKNKNEMINEIVEKNKIRIKEPEREKIFNRLNEDTNRRMYEKKQKDILEEESFLLKDQNLFNEKKYNEKQWSEIYRKRFKDYEECKKKKVEVEVQKKKIEKMIEEEEEINMCNMKKLPENRIKENTQRLFDDAKKRMIIRTGKIKKLKKDIFDLTNFHDEDDASKYMKNYKSEIYHFNRNNNNNNLNNNYYYNINNNFNGETGIKSFDRNNIIKKKKKHAPDFKNVNTINDRKILQSKINQIHYPNYFDINKINNASFDNYSSKNVIIYSGFKKTKFENKTPIINNEFSYKFPDKFSNYNVNINNNNINNYYLNNANENKENENFHYKQENIIDNYLYDYCLNKYFD